MSNARQTETDHELFKAQCDGLGWCEELMGAIDSSLAGGLVEVAGGVTSDGTQRPTQVGLVGDQGSTYLLRFCPFCGQKFDPRRQGVAYAAAE